MIDRKLDTTKGRPVGKKIKNRPNYLKTSLI